MGNFARKATLIAAVLIAGQSVPAMANCYDVIGCTNKNRFRTSDLRQMSCDLLWTIRNEIFFENGYCFETERAIETYGNDSCTVDDLAKLKLNAAERANVRTIAKVEAEKGC